MKKILLTLVGLCMGIMCFGQQQTNAPWTPNIYQEKAMIVLAVVEIDGVEQFNETLGVASFVGEECRSVTLPEYDEFTDEMLYIMTVMGTDNELITFRLWDDASGEALNYECNFTMTFVDDIIGFDESVRLPFTTPETPSTGFTLNIAPYYIDEVETALNWYFISSPIGTFDVTEVEGLITETAYDLYSFDQSGEGDEEHPFLEWRNYEAGEFTQLEEGKGYLYANKLGTQLKFNGVGFSTTTGEVTYPLAYNENANYKGFNLMGNPFGTTATIDKADFYVLANDDETNESVYVLSEGEIGVMQGVFVEANPDVEEDFVTFTAVAGGAGGEDPEDPDGGEFKKLNLRVSGNNGSDLARIRFGQGHGLTKIMFNNSHTKLCFPVEDGEYAVVYAEDMGEMPVNFKASANGTYTLSLAGENVEFNYLHLIDNMTGADVDMLATSSYSFEALTTDYASRFKLVFATGNSDENFAFFSNGNFIISNEGEAVLQVVDVTGRILKNETINGSASVNVSAASGVYMLRLINGDNVKVQKVVVK